MTRECWLIPLAYALLGIAFFPVAEWLPTQPFGTGLLMSLCLLYLLPVAIAVVCLPGLVFAALLGSARQITCLFLLFALAGFVGAFCGTHLGEIARVSGMRAFAQRSDALVSAIHQYERDNGEPPNSLDKLIPKYLESEPTTGMAAYPEYKYHRGTEAVERFHGNRWALSVDTPRNVFKYDMMVYLPNQNYPEYAHGGFLKRVGTWAYVDE